MTAPSDPSRDRALPFTPGADLRHTAPSEFFLPFLLGVFVLFTAWLGIVNQQEGRIAQIWLPNPVLYVVLMRTSWGRWPVYLGVATSANFLADLLAGDSPWLAAGLTFANISEVVLAVAPLKRWFSEGLDLTRLRHLRAFVLVSTLAAPAISATVAAAVILLHNGAPYGWTWLIWASADGLSLLVLVPLIYVLLEWRRGPILEDRWLEAVLWTALLGATLYATFKLAPYPLLFLPILVLVYMSARIGPSGLLLGIVPTAAAAFAYTRAGIGPIAQSGLGRQEQILLLEGFLAASVLAVLPVVAMLADKARLEKSLNEAKALFLGVFDSSPEMLIVQYQDAEGRIRVETCNENAARAFGRSQEACIGRTVESLIRGNASRNVAEDIEHVMRTGESVRRTREVRHRERGTIFEDISVPLRDPSTGRVTRVLSSVRDITSRLQAEKAVRVSEARLRLLAENTTDMIVEFDLGLRCTYVSPASREIIGFAPSELVGTDPYEHCLQDDAPEIQRAVAPLIDGTFSHAASTHRALHRDGRTVWIETRWSLVRSESGRPAGVVASMRDVTERKQAEIALVRAQAEAEQASAAKSDFLATMSHEIRTPLNGIAGYAGLLMTEDGLPARSRRHVERIQTASQVLKTVVDDVLDFSKIEAGRVELVPTTFGLARLVDDVVAIVRGGVPADGPHVEGEIAPSLDGAYVGDENRLRQILLNLLNNAVKFTPAGSVDLRIVDLGLEAGSRRLRFSVRDTGIGISPEQQKLLFRKFSQIDASNVRRYGGTGLGLAISQRLVGLMGGAIEVSSSLGTGSEFSFEISLPEHADAPPQVETVRLDVGSCSCRILVVEDLEANRELVVSILSAAGHETEAVVDGVEAVEKAERGGFDLILMDIQMPRMGGIAAARRIRELPGPAGEVPIVAMTANVLPSQVAAIRAAGMNDHVGKPFEIQALERTVARWVCGRAHSAPEAAPAAPLWEHETAYRTLVASIGPENSRRVFEGFEQELRRRFQDVGRADRAGLARDAHAIRGEAGQLGFPDLAQACRELEDACESGGRIERPMERVDIERRRALKAIALLRAA